MSIFAQQFDVGETVSRRLAGAEPVGADIHGVGAMTDCRLARFPVSGRGKKFDCPDSLPLHQMIYTEYIFL